MINRKAFFDGIKQGPFSARITQEQVKGIDGLLDAWEAAVAAGDTKGLNEDAAVADIVAGVMWETGARMVPVREGFAKSDAAARAYVARRHYAYAREEHGHVWYGRGRIQNTWYANYLALERRFGVPLTSNPDLVLTDWALDAKITVYGHLEGIWSVDTRPGLGRPRAKLALYFKASQVPDWLNARRIVNGTDHAAEIAAIAKQIYADLQHARVTS